MSKFDDILSDILEMHNRGYKTTSIAALLELPYDMVDDAINEYSTEYLKAFDPNSMERIYG